MENKHFIGAVRPRYVVDIQALIDSLPPIEQVEEAVPLMASVFIEQGKEERYQEGYDEGYEAGKEDAEIDCACEYCDCERCDCCDGCINEDCDCIDRIDGIAEKTDIILQTVERIDRNTMAPILA